MKNKLSEGNKMKRRAFGRSSFTIKGENQQIFPFLPFSVSQSEILTYVWRQEQATFLQKSLLDRPVRQNQLLAALGAATDRRKAVSICRSECAQEIALRSTHISTNYIFTIFSTPFSLKQMKQLKLSRNRPQHYPFQLY